MNIREFLSRIEPGEREQDCWLWVGAMGSDGYGRLRGEQGTVECAHRYAYEVFKGPIPEKLCVLHTCDTPRCVNPAHLFLGTNRDNTADMIQKNRQGNPRHKLSWEGVREIRARLSAGERKQDIASSFRICRSTVQDIERGLSWKETRDSRQMQLFPVGRPSQGIPLTVGDARAAPSEQDRGLRSSCYSEDIVESHRRAQPPRSTDPRELCNIIGGVPVKVERGFCGMCDSNISNEWCLPDHGRSEFELRHLVDIGRLRQTEYEILLIALERGEV